MISKVRCFAIYHYLSTWGVEPVRTFYYKGRSKEIEVFWVRYSKLAQLQMLVKLRGYRHDLSYLSNHCEVYACEVLRDMGKR